MRGGSISFVLLLLFLFSPRAHAATLLTVCESACAYTTITAAVEAIPSQLSDAYVIEVRDSRTYEEAIVIKGKVTSPARTITIKSSDDASPTLLARSNQYVFSIGAPYVTIDGMQFSANFRSRANAIAITKNHTTIRNSRFRYFNEATLITMREVEGNVIADNIFEKSRYTTAVAIAYYGGVNSIRRNTFFNITQGVVLSENIRGNVIEDNAFFLDGSNDTAIVSQVELARAKASRIDRNHYYLARDATLGSVLGARYATRGDDDHTPSSTIYAMAGDNNNCLCEWM